MQTNGSAEPNRERQGERKPEGSISWVSASTATRFAGASVTCRPFRNRPLGLWWHRLRRRSQQRQLPRARRMVLGERQRTGRASIPSSGCTTARFPGRAGIAPSFTSGRIETADYRPVSAPNPHPFLRPLQGRCYPNRTAPGRTNPPSRNPSISAATRALISRSPRVAWMPRPSDRSGASLRRRRRHSHHILRQRHLRCQRDQQCAIHRKRDFIVIPPEERANSASLGKELPKLQLL